MADEHLRRGELYEEEIIGFIESKKSKDFFRGKKVREPEELVKGTAEGIFAL